MSYWSSMKLLLINPKFPESFWSFSWALARVVRDKTAVNSPLGLATVAALTPESWDITIIDENVEPVDWSFMADVVGVCGMGVQVPRQKEILEHFRRRGIYTVAGGSYASLCPEEYSGSADTVVSGEAENIWPQFCADFENGAPQGFYREEGKINLCISPVPRYDLLKLDRYQKVSLQFSRGCPYQCEFCDIIVMFGRTPRTKPLEQIEAELDLLRGKGVTSIFFVDDNLIGNRAQAKKLLAFLNSYQEKHGYYFSLGTESSINMADDPELMTLFKKANFEWVFIGIETPSTESLKETHKVQNLRSDILTSVRTIYSYGIDVLAGFIVGFDSDDKTIFDRQYDFIVSSGISVAMVGLLNAMPKTPLFERLKRDGRLKEMFLPDNTLSATNVIPLKMSQEELVDGYRKLNKRLMRNGAIYRRLANKTKYLRDPLASPHLSMTQKMKYLWRMFFFGILPGGPARLLYFFRSLLLALGRPKKLVLIVTDWISALSLKAFAGRYFDQSPASTQVSLQNIHNNLLKWIKKPWQERPVAIRLAEFRNRAYIWIDLNQLDRGIRRALSKAIRQTLRKSSEAVVLDFCKLKDTNSVQLSALLKKLRRYRNQIHVYLTESLYQRLGDELVLFQYTLVAV